MCGALARKVVAAVVAHLVHALDHNAIVRQRRVDRLHEIPLGLQLCGRIEARPNDGRNFGLDCVGLVGARRRGSGDGLVEHHHCGVGVAVDRQHIISLNEFRLVNIDPDDLLPVRFGVMTRAHSQNQVPPCEPVAQTAGKRISAMPRESGWRSEMLPLPCRVVTTGICK